MKKAKKDWRDDMFAVYNPTDILRRNFSKPLFYMPMKSEIYSEQIAIYYNEYGRLAEKVIAPVPIVDSMANVLNVTEEIKNE